MNKYLPLVTGLIGSSLVATFVTRYLSKNEYDIAVSSCSEYGPTKVYIENIDTGYRVEAPDADGLVGLQRITKITNVGTKMLDSDTINVEVSNDQNGKVLEYMAFYSSILDQHEIAVANVEKGSKLFAFKLKQFNPNDQITILTNSTKQLSVNVLSKGAGFTLSQRFGETKFCSLFDFSGYGGKIVYSDLAKGCRVDKRSLDLHCEDTQSIKVPANFPSGNAQMVFERDKLFSWLPLIGKHRTVLPFRVSASDEK